MAQRIATRGMFTFTLIWLGQLISLTGSRLTGFALGVWVYQRTGSVTQFALIAVCTILPSVLLSPLAGAVVDRYDRRRVVIISDLGAGLCTLATALLLSADKLGAWSIYLAMAVISSFSAFRSPAYSAIVALVVPKEQLGRANGMGQGAIGFAHLFSPFLAGVLLMQIPLQGVLIIDFATYCFAIAMMLVVRVPRLEGVAQKSASKGLRWREAFLGWSYLKSRPGLFGLVVFFALSNFCAGMVLVLATPLILAFGSPAVLGTVLTISGTGMLAGSLVMSACGGPRRRIYAVLGFELLSGCCVIIAGLRPSATLFTAASFVFLFSLPFINGSSQAIWQSKVAPDVQGRVFALTNMIALSSLPLAYLVAGPLADHVFEPMLSPGGPLSNSVGLLIGVGQGRGIGFLFVVLGFLIILITAVSYLFPRLRMVEDELPNAVRPEEAVVVESERPDLAFEH